MDAVATSWPEVEDPTERMPIRWFEEIHLKLLELEWVKQEHRVANAATSEQP